MSGLRRAAGISLCSHLAACMLFGFSFAPARLPIPPRMVFIGEGEVSPGALSAGAPQPARLPGGMISRDPESEPVSFRAGGWPVKPLVSLPSLAADKPYQGPAVARSLPGRRESVFIFHPELPYRLDLYFKDRQEVHIELLVNVRPEGQGRPAAVRRRISSGNPEADLLSMRYISHYLFIQEQHFQPDTWHPVKIDLSIRR